MKYNKPHICIFLFLLLVLQGGMAQTGAALRDSLQAKMNLMRELVQADNFEDAQVEAGNYRDFLKRNVIYFPPAGLVMISNIYWHNKDKKGAEAMLREAEQDALRDKNLKSRQALLKTIIKAHERWENEERVQICRQILQTTEDSLAARQVKDQTVHLERQIDSLQTALQSAQQVKENTFSIEKQRAMALAGAAAFILLILVIVNLSNSRRWRKRWENREMEWELRETPEEVSTIPAMPAFSDPPADIPETVTMQAATATGTSAYEKPRAESFSLGQTEMPIALVVEHNRQIALYVRSLLSSNFEVETVSSPAEALKRANEILPDIVVCDTNIDGNAGIDIVRQIKMSERTNHIPVVLLSKHHGTEGRLDALRAGADAWFTRPMLSDEFNSTVKHLMLDMEEKHEQFNSFLQLYFTADRLPQHDRFLAAIIHFIEANIANPDFMPDEIARKMQMTNALFVRKLKALTGKEPSQLIREMRLEKAKYLLSVRAGTPQTISELVGYSNPGSFSMAFKDYFGENTSLLQMGRFKPGVN